jgi:pseudouridine-5'-monophosphatase
MDGTLLDTDGLYDTARNAILHKYGKPSAPWHIKAQIQGRPSREGRDILLAWAKLPISPEQYKEEISVLQEQTFPTTRPMPGVKELLEALSAETTKQKLHLAVATGTRTKNFKLKTSHLTELFSYFPENQIVRGDDKRLKRGKPAPDIYLLALEEINEGIRRRRTEGSTERKITADECLVFEDAVQGVEAARRAGMRVVWCPSEGLLEEYQGREKEVLAGLTGQLKEADSSIMTDGLRVEEKLGEIDDGRAELLPSLEGFPFQKYGFDVGDGRP